MMRTAIYKASSGASLASQLRARCAASAGGGGCQSLGWPLPAQQRRQQQRRLVHTIQQGSLRGLVTVVAAADSAEAASSSNGSGNGLPFALSRPRRLLRFKWGRSSRGYAASALQVEVDVLTEGRPSCVDAAQLEQLLEQLEGDAAAAVPLALRARAAAQPRYRLPAVASLSLVLCDDQHIRSLNQQYRGKDTATDVLSFEIPDEAPGLVLPIKLLGDLVISLDTAQRQANERGHSLLDEARVLLVHGLLHLVGFDHEQGDVQHAEMAQHEADMLADLGWRGSGLIAAAEEEAQQQNNSNSSSSTSSSGGAASAAADGSRLLARRKPRVRLVALDMDGTLLDSNSRITPDSVEAVQSACAAGVRVLLATGKARPAAIAAAARAGLEGDSLLVSCNSPGVFLQGLAVHGHGGVQLSDAALPACVVSDAFTWAEACGVSCVAFLGDECATLTLTDDVRELHSRYYEPLARECSSVEQLLQGPAVRKLLFMAAPSVIETDVRRHWAAALRGGDAGAELLQAVPNMLEVVPTGVNKWAGLSVLLKHLDIPANELLAVGDGGNDLQMITHAGLGIAMGNAVPEVKAAADVVVASNDDGGIAEVFARFVL